MVMSLASAYAELIGESLIFDHTKFHFTMSNGYETVKLVQEIIDGPSYVEHTNVL